MHAARVNMKAVPGWARVGCCTTYHYLSIEPSLGCGLLLNATLALHFQDRCFFHPHRARRLTCSTANMNITRSMGFRERAL